MSSVIRAGPAVLLILIFFIAILAGCTQSGTTGQGTVSPLPSATIPVPPSPVTEAEMVAFVDEAVAYANEHGKSAALAEFSDPNGSFFRQELYIYAYDFDGVTIAHPVNPEKIGVLRLYEPDATGSCFIYNLREAARNGSGFVTYSYINPAHNNAVEQKLGYVRKVDDTWWLGSGIYIGTVTTSGTS